MKKLILTLVLVLLTVPAFARTRHVIINNNTTVVNNINDDESFDYGAYADVIVAETPKTEWGFKTTWLQESQEARVYFGGKIYLNRMIK